MIGREVKKYCCEDISKIENYHDALSDLNNVWHCHHKLELCDGKINSKKFLVKNGLYYNRPANELIFLSPKNHTLLHREHLHHLKFSKIHTFNDFLQEKKKIQRKYDFWNLQNPEKIKLNKNRMASEIQELLDIYEKNEKRCFKKESEAKEFCKITTKMITHISFGGK